MGAMAAAEVIGSPIHPPSPTEVMTESATTSMIANVPLMPRISAKSISDIAAKLAGTSALRSFSETSMKVWLKIARPVIRTSMPGKRSRISSLSPRADSVTSETFGQHLFAGKPQGDVDAADRAVAGDETRRETRVGEGDGTDPGPLAGIAARRLVHEIANQDVVAVGRGVLEVGDGVDADRVRDLPGPLGEPGGGFEGEGPRWRRGPSGTTAKKTLLPFV